MVHVPFIVEESLEPVAVKEFHLSLPSSYTPGFPANLTQCCCSILVLQLDK
jgi:hypothetical protein